MPRIPVVQGTCIACEVWSFAAGWGEILVEEDPTLRDKMATLNAMVEKGRGGDVTDLTT